MRVLQVSWLVESGEMNDPRAGSAFDAAMELWCWRMRPPDSQLDGITELDGADPQGHWGGLTELTGEIRIRDGRGWFLAVGDVLFGGTDDLLTLEQGMSRPEVGERVSVEATIAIAPAGTSAYWAPAGASRRWAIESVVAAPAQPDDPYVLDVIPTGDHKTTADALAEGNGTVGRD